MTPRAVPLTAAQITMCGFNLRSTCYHTHTLTHTHTHTWMWDYSLVFHKPEIFFFFVFHFLAIRHLNRDSVLTRSWLLPNINPLLLVEEQAPTGNLACRCLFVCVCVVFRLVTMGLSLSLASVMLSLFCVRRDRGCAFLPASTWMMVQIGFTLSRALQTLH